MIRFEPVGPPPSTRPPSVRLPLDRKALRELLVQVLDEPTLLAVQAAWTWRQSSPPTLSEAFAEAMLPSFFAQLEQVLALAVAAEMTRLRELTVDPTRPLHDPEDDCA